MNVSTFSYRTLFFLVVYLGLFFATCNNALFWDTIQFSSLHPNWYYENNFNRLWLPPYIDSGHPMTFGMYIAACWKLFGRSLLVTHLAMLPFVIILIVQAVRLGKLVFKNDDIWAWLCTALLLSEAILMSQVTLVSPDVVLAALFLLAINAVLADRRRQLMLAVAGLGIISTRGMMTGVCLYIFLCVHDYTTLRRKQSIVGYLWRNILPFLPGGLLALAYQIAHLYYTGQSGMGSVNTSAWAPSFGLVDFATWRRNFVIMIWRIVDSGRVLTIIAFTMFSLSFLRGHLKTGAVSGRLVYALWGLVISIFLVMLAPLTFFEGLLGHRYFLPFAMVIQVQTVILIFCSSLRYKKHLVAILILVQLSGHFWIYPRGLSMGWDSTLAHLPYFGLRKEFNNFMTKHSIKHSEVGSQFPLTGSGYEIDLNEEKAGIMDALDRRYKYVLYSNVCNRLHDSLDVYYQSMEVLKYEKRGAVEMILFKEK